MPLGYSAMGIAVAVGEAVEGIQPGDRVATASAGHGDYQLVPGLLCAKVPDNVDDASAAFATVGAIALHGLRQGELTVDESVAVIGLGLVGQVATRLAQASGLRVIGIDLQPHLVELAEHSGIAAHVETGAATTRAILDATDSHGVDAILITAATQSSEPVSRATDILRDRGRIVVVGDVGLDLDRRPFYEKEIDLRFARSYGPGRYDRSYEEFAIDMPAGYVRWTEGRNLQAVLSLISRGLVSATDLVTKTYPLNAAEEAYASFSSTPAPLGVQFTYDAPAEQPPRASRPTPEPLIKRDPGDLRAGIIGAGTYAKATLLPALQKAGWPRPVAITSASGLNARTLANKFNIPTVAPDADALINDPNVSVVFILSRHDSHADLTEQALLAGKDVFVEKPLALTWNELERVQKAQHESGRILWAGFNRRHSPALALTLMTLNASQGPLAVTYRINAGQLPERHWYHDRRQGGRLLGEVCHFVDSASWIVGQQPNRVAGMSDGRGETLLQENVTALLSYPNGSTASIIYNCDASPSTPKEQIEVLGRGHTVAINNFTELTIDGRRAKPANGSKGHWENLDAFRRAIRGESPRHEALEATEAAFATTAATLQIARSIATGSIVTLDR